MARMSRNPPMAPCPSSDISHSINAVASSIFTCGCFSGFTAITPYWLKSSGSPSKTILAVQPFSIAAAFQGKGIVYRTGEDQYESDFYHEYFVSPAPMMTEQTRNWLADSNVFGQVLSPISSVKPTHVLEGHIKQIAADLRDKKNPQAVLEISFFLLEQKKQDRSIRYRKTYLEMLPLESKTASACIDALNGCLEQILTDLENDLASNLEKK